LAALRTAQSVGGVSGLRTPRRFQRGAGTTRVDHKAGNRFCRHVLVEAAWHYHYRPNLSREIKARQVGQPPAVVAHAWKAQQRLHKRFEHLAYRKDRRIAVVGVARELVGFLWAVMRDLPTPAIEVPSRSE